MLKTWYIAAFDGLEFKQSAGITQAFPPQHLPTYSEHLYVLEDEFTVYTETGSVVLKPGDNFHIPQGTAHAVVSGPAGARGLVVASPSGFARLIQEAGTPAESSSILPTTPPDMEAFSQALLEVGDELGGPAAPSSVSRLASQFPSRQFCSSPIQAEAGFAATLALSTY
jgi:hypothetical protein